MNKVILIGNVGSDIDLRYTQSGKSVCNFSLATNDWKDHTEWHRIDAWESTAELISKYVEKGNKVCVEGSLQTKKYEDKDGNTRYQTSVVCNRIEFLNSKADNEKVEKNNSNKSTGSQPGYSDDDIPF